MGLVAAGDGSVDLRANSQGAGFIVINWVGHAISIDFSEPVWGPVASLCSDTAGSLSILQQKVEECYNGRVQLTTVWCCH